MLHDYRLVVEHAINNYSHFIMYRRHTIFAEHKRWVSNNAKFAASSRTYCVRKLTFSESMLCGNSSEGPTFIYIECLGDTLHRMTMHMDGIVTNECVNVVFIGEYGSVTIWSRIDFKRTETVAASCEGNTLVHPWRSGGDCAMGFSDGHHSVSKLIRMISDWSRRRIEKCGLIISKHSAGIWSMYESQTNHNLRHSKRW